MAGPIILNKNRDRILNGKHFAPLLDSLKSDRETNPTFLTKNKQTKNKTPHESENDFDLKRE